ncbi:hypothetical protein [Lichenibacterium dinghuense]|uniref:hypothetical protein n=1 Tax=Lichenibacterium dinghuense TaxID=2895977 RepID=UPI001F3C174D|nr:hypothetical protein [Lichenibacterium sp. 6Y81]
MTSRTGTAPCPARASLTASPPPGVLGLALSSLHRLFRARPPDAGRLSDRQLADISLTRADLPDHRGWRR